MNASDSCVTAALAGLSVLASSLVVTLPPWVLFAAFLLGICISASGTFFGDRLGSWGMYLSIAAFPCCGQLPACGLSGNVCSCSRPAGNLP
ncbi:MAG: hypothetical protein IH600_07465 [Bacteroidetes bacterium]|nr:hypothetical protein [Bacteroidota bacterium]